MCEYCDSEEKLLLSRHPDNMGNHVAIFGRELVLIENDATGTPWETDTIEISFCPMCGKDLSGR